MNYGNLSAEQRNVLKKTGIVVEGSEASIDFLVDSYLLAEEGMSISEIRALKLEQKAEYAEKMVKAMESHPVIGEVDGGADKVKENLEWLGGFFAKAIGRIKTSGVKFPQKKDYKDLQAIKELGSSDFMYAADYARRFSVYTELITNHAGINRTSAVNKYGIDMGVSFVKGYGGKRYNGSYRDDLSKTNEYKFARDINLINTLRSFNIANNAISDSETDKKDRAIIKTVTELNLLGDLEGKDVNSLDKLELNARGEINLAWLGISNTTKAHNVNTKKINYKKLELKEEEIDTLLNENAQGTLAKALTSEGAKKTMYSNYKMIRAMNIKKIMDDVFVNGDHYEIYELENPHYYQDGRGTNKKMIVNKGDHSTIEYIKKRYSGGALKPLATKFDETFLALEAYENPLILMKNKIYDKSVNHYDISNTGGFAYKENAKSELIDVYDESYIRSANSVDYRNKAKQAEITKQVVITKLGEGGENLVGYRPIIFDDEGTRLTKLDKIVPMKEIRTKEEAEKAREEETKKADAAEVKRIENILSMEKTVEKNWQPAEIKEEVKVKAEVKENKEEVKSEAEAVPEEMVFEEGETAAEVAEGEEAKEEVKEEVEEEVIEDEVKEEKAEKEEAHEDDTEYKPTPFVEKLDWVDFFDMSDKDVLKTFEGFGITIEDPMDARPFVYMYALGIKKMTLDDLYNASPEEKKALGKSLIEDYKKNGLIGAAAGKLKRRQAEKNLSWYGKMMDEAMRILKKENLKLPNAKQAGSVEQARRLRHTKLWAASIMNGFVTILEGQGLVFSKDNKKSKNNPLEIAQMYWFKEEYGVQFELDKAMLSAIDTACGTMMNYWDESVPLELKVKSKLLAEFTYNGQNIVNKEDYDEKVISRVNKDLIDTCYVSDFAGFNGVFTKKEMEKILATPAVEIKTSDSALYEKMKSTIEKAVAREAKKKGNRDFVERKKGELKYQWEIISPAAKQQIEIEGLGAGYEKESFKSANDYCIALDEICASFKLRSDEAKAAGHKELAEYFDNLAYLSDYRKVDLKKLCEEDPTLRKMLEFVKNGPFTANLKGKSVVEIYESVTRIENSRNTLHGYMMMTGSITDMIRRGNGLIRENIDEQWDKIRAEYDSAVEMLRKGITNGGDKEVDTICTVPVSNYIGEYDHDSSICMSHKIYKSVITMNIDGWDESEKSLVRAMGAVNLAVRTAVRKNAILVKNGDKEARKKQADFLRFDGLVRGDGEGNFAVKSAVDKLNLLHWYKGFIKEYGKDPMFAQIKEEIDFFKENEYKITAELQKAALKELNDSRKDPAKNLELLLKLFEAGINSGTEEKVSRDYLEKLSKAELNKLHDTWMEMLFKNGTVASTELYTLETMQSELTASKELGGEPYGFGRLKYAREQMLTEGYFNKLSNPVKTGKTSVIAHAAMLRRTLISLGLNEDDLKAKERKRFIDVTHSRGLYRLYEMNLAFDRKGSFPIKAEFDGVGKIVSVDVPKDKDLVYAQEAEKIEPELYSLMTKVYKVVDLADDLLEELKNEDIGDVLNEIKKISGFDEENSLLTYTAAADEIEIGIAKLKENKADDKVIGKIEKFCNRAKSVFDEKYYKHVSFDSGIKIQLAQCKKGYTAEGYRKSDKVYKSITEKRQAAEDAKKVVTDRREEKRLAEEQRKAAEKKENARKKRVFSKIKDFEHLDEEGKRLNSNSPEYEENLKKQISALRVVYTLERSAEIELVNPDKTLAGGGINYDRFCEKLFKTDQDKKMTKNDTNLACAIFNLLPANTDEAVIDSIASLAPFKQEHISTLCNYIKSFVGNAKVDERSLKYINDIDAASVRITEHIMKLDEVVDAKKPHHQNVDPRESRRLNDALKTRINGTRSYEEVYAAIGELKNSLTKHVDILHYTSYAIAAVKLAEEGVKFSRKTLDKKAEQFKNEYLKDEALLWERYRDASLKESISGAEGMKDLEKSMSRDIYGIANKDDCVSYVKDMDKLHFNMMDNVQPEKRSEAYQKLVRAVKEAAEMEVTDAQPYDALVVARKNEAILKAAFEYMGNKMKKRSSWDGQARFENGLDALAVVWKYTPGARHLIADFVAKINKERGLSRRSTDPDYVKIEKYGAQNAEDKEIAREMDKTYGKKANISVIKRRRAIRNQGVEIIDAPLAAAQQPQQEENVPVMNEAHREAERKTNVNE